MILMNDFKAEPAALREAMLDAAQRVLESGWYILGNEVASFEGQWAAACGVSHGVGVANGMDAIEIGLRSLGIGPGDEVITTPMTAFATVLAILRAGAVPVFADIEPGTALLSRESVARCVSPRTRAVLLVHLYGQIRDMDHWTELCREHGILLLEDCAQAHLARWHEGMAGSFAAFGAYSFYPTKNLGAIGDGGMLVTHDAALCECARRMRNYGQSERYHHPEIGLNSRLDELQAAILAQRLRWLESFTERRRQIAHAYAQGIANPRIALLAEPMAPENHVHHLFVVLCEERDRLHHALAASGISSLSHYPVPAHMQPPCRSAAADPAGLPHAEQHARRCLSIPCHPQMTDAEVGQVIEAVNAFE